MAFLSEGEGSGGGSRDNQQPTQLLSFIIWISSEIILPFKVLLLFYYYHHAYYLLLLTVALPLLIVPISTRQYNQDCKPYDVTKPFQNVSAKFLKSNPTTES